MGWGGGDLSEVEGASFEGLLGAALGGRIGERTRPRGEPLGPIGLGVSRPARESAARCRCALFRTPTRRDTRAAAPPFPAPAPAPASAPVPVPTSKVQARSQAERRPASKGGLVERPARGRQARLVPPQVALELREEAQLLLSGTVHLRVRLEVLKQRGRAALWPTDDHEGRLTRRGRRPRLHDRRVVDSTLPGRRRRQVHHAEAVVAAGHRGGYGVRE